ncbi:hypothetical protein EI290_15455 [Hymenobacter metallilatus]|uniref:Uncharacterized protein n=1 Tax=Hymenobacter metallilatus TaxID=2493666 RepID=A0A3R9MFZ0_9BACT|nr:hypothetical protein EI290_15455 [Hymenobacter metallilatus]
MQRRNIVAALVDAGVDFLPGSPDAALQQRVQHQAQQRQNQGQGAKKLVHQAFPGSGCGNWRGGSHARLIQASVDGGGSRGLVGGGGSIHGFGFGGGFGGGQVADGRALVEVVFQGRFQLRHAGQPGSVALAGGRGAQPVDDFAHQRLQAGVVGAQALVHHALHFQRLVQRRVYALFIGLDAAGKVLQRTTALQLAF